MHTQTNRLENALAQIGKKFLSFKGNHLPTTRKALTQQMKKNWASLEKDLRGTQIHKDLKLTHIQTYEHYVSHVPVKDYDFYSPYVERICDGHKDILFKGKPECFGLSSGTSGQDSKKVPYNSKMIEHFLKSQMLVAAKLSAKEPQSNLLLAERLTFGSAPSVYEKNGINFGYISGILSTKIPSLLKKRTFPSNEILSINNWDQKIEMLIAETINKDIKIITGIPTYIISILEAILKKTGKESINQIWPNLKFFVYAATPIKQYKSQIDHLIGHELTYYGLYAATEASLGLPYDRTNDEGQLYLLNPNLLYSFTSTDDATDIRGVHNLELGQSYFVNIGTVNGFIHYAMKDEIVFNLKGNDLVFEFVGRKNTGMNLAAEKVTEDEILKTIIVTKEKLNFDIKHYLLSPGKGEEKQNYHWTLFTDGIPEHNRGMVGQTLDKALQEINLDYKDCRDIAIIDSPSVTFMHSDKLNQYFERHREKGQFKMKTSFPSSEDYYHFIKLHFSEAELGA